MTNLGPLTRPYQCKASDQSVTGDQVSVDRVVGNHVEGKSDNDVKVVNIQSIKSKRIPAGFANSFGNVEGIFAFSSEKNVLLGEDLAPFSKLKYFDISFNWITHLPSDAFAGNPQLEWIDFSQNRLKLVGLNILDSLNSLHYANFGDNICINELGRDKTDIVRNIKRLLKRNCQPFDQVYTGTTPSSIRSYPNLYPSLPPTPIPDVTTTTTQAGFFKKIFG
jgi:hypothetical protein